MIVVHRYLSVVLTLIQKGCSAHAQTVIMCLALNAVVIRLGTMTLIGLCKGEEMDVSKIKLPIGVIGLIIAQSFAVIWYVAQLVSTVDQNTTAIESYEEYDSSGLEEAIEDLEDRIADLETKDAII